MECSSQSSCPAYSTSHLFGRPAAGMVTEAFSDFVVGHGELWCALLFNATLRSMGVDSAFMDSREVLVVTATTDGNSVDVEYEDSNQQLDRWAQKHGSPAVSPAPCLTCRTISEEV